MKPGELRIKNIVEYEGRIFEIHTIAEEFPTLNTDEFGIGVVSWNNIKPIELTEEWLLKFGFEKLDIGDQFYILIENFNLKVSLNFKMVAWHNLLIHEFQPKYVHQLQNLFFALTGEELTIKEN